MKRFSLFIFTIVIMIVTSFAREFTYKGIYYTVIDENAKTCKTSEGYVIKMTDLGHLAPGSFG